MDFIDLKAQQALIKTKLDERIQEVMASGRYIMGPQIKELEDALSEYTGAKHCLSCSSGTDALLLAMMALGVKAGDEVITTPFTFIATGEMIALLGAKPVYVDIDPATYNIDPGKIAEAITDKTKAIIPVSLYGQCADMNEINKIAADHDLPVIEDAAQSFGATYQGKKSCTLTTIGCTSFFPAKPLGCYGDGGACFTDDAELATQMRYLRAHGQDRRYHHPLIGLNARMDTMQAAILMEKLAIFPNEVEARAKIGARYSQEFGDSVKTPVIKDGNTHVYAQYTVEVDNRTQVQEALKEKGIPTAVHYPVPLHLQPAFGFLGQGEGTFPVAEAASQRVMSLPMHPYLKEEDQDTIVAAVKAAC
ncbi:DegT/DnrJ/EryC1/StrS family aminotransferase [Dethiosulfatarculus sandiegensis]|uniref:DegT/DnrJ/EryC1/StrS family aminotransferase n=1 Tax=Dethiosulfatarculus sandiegensis TaxID=1429043 RepID=UPI0005CA7EE8|nr:DegT/DnrJ/EryC1/StrS family aminotransferase [Dethiosulfatarculus sandiegensis]